MPAFTVLKRALLLQTLLTALPVIIVPVAPGIIVAIAPALGLLAIAALFFFQSTPLIVSFIPSLLILRNVTSLQLLLTLALEPLSLFVVAALLVIPTPAILSVLFLPLSLLVFGATLLPLTLLFCPLLFILRLLSLPLPPGFLLLLVFGATLFLTLLRLALLVCALLIVLSLPLSPGLLTLLFLILSLLLIFSAALFMAFRPGSFRSLSISLPISATPLRTYSAAGYSQRPYEEKNIANCLLTIIVVNPP